MMHNVRWMRVGVVVALLLVVALPVVAQSDAPEGPADGCGAPVPVTTGEAQEFRMTSGGLDRAYLLYVPDSYDPATPTPLVMSLHGFSSFPRQQMFISAWNEVADEHGFIVVYPSGTGLPLRWISGGGFGEPQRVDDVAFISDLIDELAASYCLDPARVYANGFSNGGGMSYRLGCDLADRIAAIGTVAGAYSDPPGGCEPGRPLPVIGFHGTDDDIVPYDGQRGGTFRFPPVLDWAADWAARNACATRSEPDVAAATVTAVRWGDCAGDVEVVFYTIEGAGHVWPGGGALPAFIVGDSNDAINTSAVMWDFFSQYTAPQ